MSLLTVLGFFLKNKKKSSYNDSADLHIMSILTFLILTDITLTLLISKTHLQDDQKHVLNGYLHMAFC